MSEDAIQEDVSEESAAEGQELRTGLSKRDELLSAIVDRRRRELAEATASGDTSIAERGDGDLPLRRDGDKWFTRVKVNGEEMEVPFTDVVAKYQKDSAAERRLAEAAERQKQLDQYAARLEQRERDIMARLKQTTPTAPVPRPGQKPGPSIDARKITEALYSGDEDAATKAFEALLAQTRQESPVRPPVVNEDVIAARVQQRIDAENTKRKQLAFERRRVEALEKFKEEYRDVWDDPYLKNLADEETVRLYNENPNNDPWEIMKSSAESVRNWLKTRTGTHQDRGSKKRSATSVTGAARARANLSPEDNAPKTASDVIADIKRARGQA